jgi:2',3'-cyclic-nucleotide 2'-phosphodiesterase (5'-nucleotidase family)
MTSREMSTLRWKPAFLGLVLSASLLASSCQTARVPADSGAAASDVRISYTVVSEEIPADPAVEALIRPFRSEMESRVSEVIAQATGEFTRGKPEGTLGNITADAMLVLANELAEHGPVHMAITNTGGLRVPIAAGAVTVGNVFELMPFENQLIVLTLTGAQVDSLANNLASINGEPIAGFTFTIRNGRAYDLRVQGEPVDPSATYRLATSDFVADGGDRIIRFAEPPPREVLPILLRDTFIEYFRRLGTLEPRMEGRIRTE